MKVLVLGFYNRNNYGDDLYGSIFNSYGYTTVCTDDINIISDDITHIIIGGGELLNNYFVDKIKILLNNSKFTGIIIALSVDLGSYKEIDNLNFIDYFYVRNKDDYNLLNSIYEGYVEYIPDLILSNYDINIKSKYHFRSSKTLKTLKTSNRMNIVYCFANPLDNNINNINYIKIFLKTNYNHILLSFNTSTSLKESDIIFNKNFITMNNVTSGLQIISTLQIADIVVCSRYHSHILAIKLLKPFISICNGKSNKVTKLLKDLCLTDLVFNTENLPSGIDYINRNRKNIIKRLKIINKNNYKFSVTDSLNKKKRIIGPFFIY